MARFTLTLEVELSDEASKTVRGLLRDHKKGDEDALALLNIACRQWPFGITAVVEQK